MFNFISCILTKNKNSKVNTKNYKGFKKKNTLIFSVIANLIPYKGHADLISALGLISDEMPKDWKMIFIGRDDGIKTALIDQTKKHNISENCEFLHPKGDITDYYTIADIGILSSHEEGFSIAILESMRAALPMVVTNVGGNSESVLDGKTGFVVPAQDCQKISEAILKLLHFSI